MRAAITLRRRDMVTVVPRSGEATGAAGRAAGAAAATGALCDGADAGFAAMTSSLRIRPPIPEPRTVERLTPRSLANLRTIGVT